MAGLKTEFRATVIYKVIFGIETPMHELRILFCLAKCRAPAFFNQRHKGRKERLAHVLNKSEIRIPIAGIVIIKENPPDASCAASVRDIEILIRPRLETRIKIAAMRVAMSLLHAVEMRRVLVILQTRVKV